jgi:hypothetical protein
MENEEEAIVMPEVKANRVAQTTYSDLNRGTISYKRHYIRAMVFSISIKGEGNMQ